MTVRRFVVTAKADGSGDATVYSPYLSGKLCSISYVKTDYTNGVDFTITADVSGATLWAEQNVNTAGPRYPRVGNNLTDGTASLYVASSGTAVNDRIRLARDRVKIVVAAAGDSHTGAFHIVVED